MSNASEFEALKQSIQNLYTSGVLTHQVNPNNLDTVYYMSSGAEGVGTLPYYTSGIVKGSRYFIDPAADFTTAGVLANDILRVPFDQFSIDNIVLSKVSATELYLQNQAPVTVTSTKDEGYTILRKNTRSPLDDIFAQIDGLKDNLGLE